MTLGRPILIEKESSDLERPQVHLDDQVEFFDITEATRERLVKADYSELELLEKIILSLKRINEQLFEITEEEITEDDIACP